MRQDRRRYLYSVCEKIIGDDVWFRDLCNTCGERLWMSGYDLWVARYFILRQDTSHRDLLSAVTFQHAFEFLLYLD